MKEATNSYKSLSTILNYFGLGKEDYWHIDYPEYDFPYNGKNYFFDISKKATWFEGEFDKNGIYLYKGSDGKNYYSVINLAQYALGAYEEYLKTNEPKWYSEFIKHCDWLVNNQEEFKETQGVWINRYPMDVFNLKHEWSSALSQAFGISALTRAYRETGNDKYLEAAKKAMDAFYKNVKEGGVLFQKNDFICFEEYTTPTPSCVLNGHIFAIWSLFDMKELVKDEKIENLYFKSIKSLAANIKRWDIGYWSRYDLWDKHYNVASYFYHKLHIKQLRILYKLTDNKVFKEYADKWESRKNNIIFSSYALIRKIIFRLKRK
jgi:heparosan-N-sulfate-glucuronate 5-epimerase